VTKVSSTEFQNHAGQYLEQSGKQPVFITRFQREVRVLLDIDEYNRLKRLDTRRARKIEDLAESEIEAIAKGEMATGFTHLEREMKD
jgi:prevent-host-death family protein